MYKNQRKSLTEQGKPIRFNGKEPEIINNKNEPERRTIKYQKRSEKYYSLPTSQLLAQQLHGLLHYKKSKEEY